MKLNRGGLKLCAAYIVFVALMLTLAYFADPKGRFFFASLAWFPAGTTFGIFNLYPLMYPHPWTRFLGPPVSILIVYLIGWAISAAKSRLS